MGRRAKPFLHQGWYYTTAGGSWRKLVPEAAGLEAAEEALASLQGGERAPGRVPGGPTVAEAAEAYVSHCTTYYTLPGGGASAEVEQARYAFKRLVEAVGSLPLADLRVEHLEEARDAMRATCCRKTINAVLSRQKRAATWWAQKKLITRAHGLELRDVASLPAYRSGVKEHPPVRAVTWEDVGPIVEAIREPWKSLILVQWWSGLRPGEACGLRRSWLTPVGDCLRVDFGLEHKGGWRGKEKSVFLGPKTVAILRPWLDAAEVQEREAVFTTRDHGKAVPAGEESYRQAVYRACKALGVPQWSPNQIRHAAATRVRGALGLEAAQHALGHARADVTQIYAETAEAERLRVAKLTG